MLFPMTTQPTVKTKKNIPTNSVRYLFILIPPKSRIRGFDSGVRAAPYHDLLPVTPVKNISRPVWTVPNLYPRPVVSQHPIFHNPSSPGSWLERPYHLRSGQASLGGHFRAAQLIDPSFLTCKLAGRLCPRFRFARLAYSTNRSAEPSDPRQRPGLRHAR